MKSHDLTVLKQSFPKIPELVLVVEKNGEIETFQTWKALEEWVHEVFDKEIYHAWCDADTDDKRGYEDQRDWFLDWDKDAMVQFLSDYGWNLMRKEK